MSKPGEETHLKKIITQVRWPDRNENIKIEEASTLIYSAPKTGDILSASEIILYASPYYRILPNTYTTLTAEIHDANGNIVTHWSGTINFAILSGNTLGYLAPVSENTTNGIVNVKYISYSEADGSVSIQASSNLDGVGGDDVFDTITITISTGAEGIILVPSTDYSSVGTSVGVSLYVVDASYDYILEGGSHIIKGYDGIISLNVSGPASLSRTTITTLNGTASFTVNSNGTPGTVEITASAPDLDIGYTKVTFSGGAKSIQLTPKYGSIYEGESIEITITILDENKNPTPFSGSITITSDSEGSFTPISPIEFDNVSFKIVDFSYNVATEGIEITATCDGLTPDSIYIDVLESLTPSYLELTAIPSNVKADGLDYSFITATVYDNGNPTAIVTNYATPITFWVPGEVGYFLNGEIIVKTLNVTPNNGQAYIELYSSLSGTATVNATSGGITEDNINIIFYSEASGLKITPSKGTVVANGVDYSLITVEIIDNNNYVVSDYVGKISLSTTKGYFEVAGASTTTLSFTNEGSKSVKLYSNSGISEAASITAEANVTDAGFSATASTSVAFTQPVVKNITFVIGSVESFSAYQIIKFDIKVTGADVNLSSMLISWAADAKLEKIEIMSPKSSSGTYQTTKVTNGVIGVSSPYTYGSINTTLYYAEPGLSTIRLTFLSKNNVMRYETIYVTFYDNEKNYPITVYVPK
jgi:hypothetical protein